jgi:PadR family transcriptional regulator, regulatory protein PadR
MDTSQLLKGVLDVAVLAALRESDGYGYDVVRRLRAAGLSDVGDASVYGTLRRLYNAGALTTYVVPSDEGPHRKYYALNQTGRDLLERSAKVWQEFADTLTRLIDSGAKEAA